MLAGEDYQAINEEYRLPVCHPNPLMFATFCMDAHCSQALEDTLLLCTTEINLENLNGKAKL